MNSEDILHALEARDRQNEERLREMLLAEGRPDILAWYDQNMKNNRLGITGAHDLWHSLSGAQRQALILIAEDAGKAVKTGNGYGVGTKGKLRVRIATIRNLAAHGLLDWAGSASGPEAEAVLNERGRFLLQHGPEHSCPTCRK